MQQLVERMQVVIAHRADRAQRRLQLVRRQQAIVAQSRADLHAVIGDLPSRRARASRRSGRIVEQDRIGVVDVDQDAPRPGCRERPRPCRRARSRSCAPCAGRSWRRGRRDHLVVAPQRAVEQHGRSAGEPSLQSRRSCRRSRGRRPAACRPTGSRRRPCRPPCQPAPAATSRSRDRARPCPARRTARPRARCRCRRHDAARTPAERHRLAAHALVGQHVEDRIGLQHAQHPVAAIESERLPLAHVQQARDRIDVGAGQDHAFDRRGAQPVARVEDRLRLDLLAQIGRGVDQEPALAVAAHCQRGLRAPLRAGITGRARDGRLLRSSSTGGSRRRQQPLIQRPSPRPPMNQGRRREGRAKPVERLISSGRRRRRS